MNLEELLDFFTKSSYEANYAMAKSTRKCAMCGQQAESFRCASAKLEYEISALCQHCQDKYFSNKDQKR